MSMANYMRVMGGHCYICHKDWEGNGHLCGGTPTACKARCSTKYQIKVTDFMSAVPDHTLIAPNEAIKKLWEVEYPGYTVYVSQPLPEAVDFRKQDKVRANAKLRSRKLAPPTP